MSIGPSCEFCDYLYTEHVISDVKLYCMVQIESDGYKYIRSMYDGYDTPKWCPMLKEYV